MRWRIAIAVGCVLGVSALRACAQELAPALAEPLLRDVPADADAALVVVGAAAQRTTDAGAALLAMVEESGLAHETFRAWADLSRELGWSPSEAFDALLGRRVMVVVRGGDPLGLNAGAGREGRSDWAIVSEVSPAAEARVRERLRPAPRRTHGGLMVLSLEGRLELVVSRGEVCRILLAPADHGGLFDEMAARLGRPATPRAADACDAAILVRRGTGALRAGISFEPDGWHVGVVAPREMVYAGERPEPSSARLVSAFEPGSLAVVVWQVGVLPRLAEWLGAPALPWPLRGEGVGPRLALVVRGEGEARSETPVSISAAAVPLSRGDPPRIAVTLGVQASVAALTRESDRAMERLVISLARGEWVQEAARMDVALAGDETAVRGFRLGEDVEMCASLTPDITARFGPDPTLSWCARPMGRWGWWVGRLALSGTAAADADIFVRAESGTVAGGGAAPKPRLTTGAVRLAALWSVLGRTGPATRVRTLRWDAWLGEDGLVEGFVRITMTK
ncbi:MAG: hypothetical protein JNM80_01455 [Phycisphaerae bacterium]|nr:hypothetical protein [Phycisphaerae bacterium]